MSHTFERSEPLRDGDEQVDYASLLTQFASTDLSRHLALFYRSTSEQLPVAAAFVAQGLERGERCLYVADENDPETVTEYLRDRGVDVEQRTASGQLDVVDATDIYVAEEFDPDGTVQALIDQVEGSLESGFDGFRVAGENTWCFHLESAFDDVLEFETRFDERCPEFPVSALCQYDVTRFSDAAVGAALQTHEQIVYRGTVVSNPYYVPPAEYRESGRPKTNAELLLEQTLDVAAFRGDVEDREQRLSVVNRVLRHNLRNELNVALGRLEWLRTQGLVAEEGIDHLETVETVMERLVELSEQARHVDRTLNSFRRGSDPVVDVVARAVETAERETGEDVDIDVTAGNATVDRALRVALVEVLVVACSKNPPGPPSVGVRCVPDRHLVNIEIRGERPLVPEQSRTALEQGFEEALEHSFGLRMWVAKWVIESANGRISVADDGDEEVITIELPVVAVADEA